VRRLRGSFTPAGSPARLLGSSPTALGASRSDPARRRRVRGLSPCRGTHWFALGCPSHCPTSCRKPLTWQFVRSCLRAAAAECVGLCTKSPLGHHGVGVLAPSRPTAGSFSATRQHGPRRAEFGNRRLLAASAVPGRSGTGPRMPNAAPPLPRAARRRATDTTSPSPGPFRRARCRRRRLTRVRVAGGGTDRYPRLLGRVRRIAGRCR